jgi:hypothetical protein
MAVTPTDIVNEAIQLIGDNQPLVTGTAPNFDSSPAGVAAAQLYNLTVATVGRRFAWDFSRKTVALTLSGNTPPFPWTVEYLYPADAVQVWQIIPPSTTDANNPLPLNWIVANNIVSGSQKKVIQANLSGALAVYNNNPTPDVWDPGFRQSVVELLSRGLAMAIAGKPDLAQAMLTSANSFEQLAETRDS